MTDMEKDKGTGWLMYVVGFVVGWFVGPPLFVFIVTQCM